MYVAQFLLEKMKGSLGHHSGVETPLKVFYDAEIKIPK